MERQLARLDLNLLVSLDALLRERSVTRAAERLQLSQPALSASLGRLRRHFDDELLQRVGNTYVLTPLAATLVERTTVALAGIERVFASQTSFDPMSTTREWVIHLSDYAAVVLGEPLAQMLALRAPYARLRLEQLRTSVVDRAAEALRTRDFMVLPHGFVSDLRYTDLYTDHYVCLVAADNSKVDDEVTMAHLAELPMVSAFHGQTALHTALRQLSMAGVEPSRRIITDGFLITPFLVRGSDRVSIVPARLAAYVAVMPDLRVLPLPLDVRIVQALWWHPMHDSDPSHRWLRMVLQEVAGQLAAED